MILIDDDLGRGKRMVEGENEGRSGRVVPEEVGSDTGEEEDGRRASTSPRGKEGGMNSITGGQSLTVYRLLCVMVSFPG